MSSPKSGAGEPGQGRRQGETLAEVLAWLEDNFGGDEAVADSEGRRWSFAELNDHARRTCAAYRELAGVGAGDRVSWLAMGSSAPLLAASFGTKKLGAVPVIVNPRSSPERICWMLANAGVKVLAYSADCRDLVRRLRDLGAGGVSRLVSIEQETALPGDISLEELAGDFAGAGECSPAGAAGAAGETGAGDICLISYTSGTTGHPKAIVHTEQEWAWTTAVMAYVLGLSHADVAMVAMPPAFIGWAHATCAAFRAGAKQVVQRFEPAHFLQSARQEHGTHALLSPTLVRLLLAALRSGAELQPVESLRTCLVGGEAVTTEVIAAVNELFPNARRVSSLGATEGILLHSGSASDYLDEHPSAIGKPVPGMTIELRDEESGEVITSHGRPGVLYARGPGVAAGVWGDPEATARAFPGGWWRSGDVLVRDERGWYGYVGRDDHMFKSGNIKVYAEDVEQRLKAHPAVLDAVVVPVPDAVFGTVGFAHVRHDVPLEPESLERWWKERSYEGYGRPRHWRLWGTDPFPMVTDAKVDRRRLRALAEETTADG